MNNDLNIVSGSVTDRGLSEKRPQNEDSYLEIPASGIFAVADGVGGAQAGEVASQMAVEILAEAFTNIPNGADPEDVMRAAIERSNSAIFQMAHELPQLSSMATTIVALHLDGNIATIGHVGDSRLYRVDRDGNLYRETDDHSMVAEEVRAGRMTEEQAENHPSRNVISRALGAEPTVDPDLKTIMVDPGTAFLICSDGITRHVGDQEIKGVLTFGGEPEEVCDYLKRLCYERGAEDNLTAVVVKVGSVNGNGRPADGSEEPTIATARMAYEGEFEDTLDDLDADDDIDVDDELLELDSDERSTGRDEVHELEELDLGEDIQGPHDNDAVEPDDEIDEDDGAEDSQRPTIEMPIVPVPVPASEPVTDAETRSESVNETPDKTFDPASPSIATVTRYEYETAEEPGVLGKAAAMVGILLIGALIGLGAYHFLFVPEPAPQRGLPALSEMQSGNQQLSAFEENRRTVDKMPAEALSRFGADPRDAEDFFLVGRASLLLGRYPEAKAAFAQSRSRIAAGDVDQNNRKTIETEIALAMAVLNDTTVQTIFRSQLDSSAAATPTP